MMVSGTAKIKIYLAPKKEIHALEQNLFAICENDTHRNGNLGLKMGVSPATSHAITWSIVHVHVGFAENRKIK